MSSVGCPRCAETFRIPDAALPEGVQVRCPWCTEIFQLSEIVHHLPPMAELLDAEHQPIEMGAVSQAFQLAGATAGAGLAAPFFSSPDVAGPSADARFEPAPLDATGFSASEFEIGSRSEFAESTEQPASDNAKLKWIEGSGWVHDTAHSISEPHAVQASVPEEAALDPYVKSEDREVYEGFEEYDDEPFDEDGDDGEFAEDRAGGVVITGPVAPRPLGSASGESKVAPKLSGKPRTKKSSSPIKSIIGVILGGVASLPLAYLILWAAGKAPDLEGLPIIGEAQKKLAGVPRPIDDSPRPTRSGSAPGRSLAEDLPPGKFDTGQELSASDSSVDGAQDLASENSTPADSPAPEMNAEDEAPIELPAVDDTAVTATTSVNKEPLGTELEEPVAAPESIQSPKEPAATAQPDLSTSTSSVPEPSKELPMIPEPEKVKPDTPSVKPTPVKPAPAKPATESPEATSPTPGKVEPAKPEPAKPAAPPAGAQLLTSIGTAQAALTELDQAMKKNPGGDVKQYKAGLYKAVTAIAEAPQAMNQPETGKFLSDVASKGLLAEMVLVGPGWLKSANRSNKGLLVGGVARELPAGWTMACLGTKGMTDIKLDGVPEGLLSDGDNVLLLGKIEDATAPARVGCVFIKVQKAKSPAQP